MKNKIIDKSNADHYMWGDHCDSWVLVRSGDLSVKQETIPKGGKEQPHFHAKSQQFFYVLKGTATFYVENKTYIITEQQGLHIPPGTPHYIANESETQLEFLVISQPTTDRDRTTIDPGKQPQDSDR